VKHATFLLKLSRPGLWFATLWLYLLPTSSQPELFHTIPFWLGLFYVSFPLNFLVYSWNDSVDIETDALNPRKDSFWLCRISNFTHLRCFLLDKLPL
jgi:4-hydroxybenzoate polyprenyltransferase